MGIAPNPNICPKQINSSNILSPIDRIRGFKLAHLNVRSLPQKLDQLRILLHEKPIDILSLNETFLNEQITTDDLHIAGYMLYRKDRGSRHGGGVGIYVKDCIPSESLSIDISGVECVWIKVPRHHHIPLVVGSMYRPPSAGGQYHEHMVDVVEHFTNCANHVIVTGDFTYNCAPDVKDCCHISHI
jgi:exonuclease III